MAAAPGFEPGTPRVKAECSAAELCGYVECLRGLEPPTCGLGTHRSHPTELQTQIYMVCLKGLEPPTRRLEVGCSIPSELQAHMVGEEGVEPTEV